MAPPADEFRPHLSIFGTRAERESWPHRLHSTRLQPASRGEPRGGARTRRPNVCRSRVGPPLVRKWGRKSPTQPVIRGQDRRHDHHTSISGELDPLRVRDRGCSGRHGPRPRPHHPRLVRKDQTPARRTRRSATYDHPKSMIVIRVRFVATPAHSMPQAGRPARGHRRL
jgi:hypothetical protein